MSTCLISCLNRFTPPLFIGGCQVVKSPGSLTLMKIKEFFKNENEHCKANLGLRKNSLEKSFSFIKRSLIIWCVFGCVSLWAQSKDIIAKETNILPYLFPHNINEVIYRRDFGDGSIRYYHIFHDGNNYVVKSCQRKEQLPLRELAVKTKICGRNEEYVWSNNPDDMTLYISGMIAPTNVTSLGYYNKTHAFLKSHSKIGLTCLSLGLELPFGTNGYIIDNDMLLFNNTSNNNKSSMYALSIVKSNTILYYNVKVTTIDNNSSNIIAINGELMKNYKLMKKFTMKLIYPHYEDLGRGEIISFVADHPLKQHVFTPDYHIVGGISASLFSTNNVFSQQPHNLKQRTVYMLGYRINERTARYVIFAIVLLITVVICSAIALNKKHK
jgi:hypothetical protein